MSNIELISYKEYPADQYTKAICIMRLDGQHVVSYGLKIFKNGGMSWRSASHSVTDNGVKENIEGYMAESRSREKQIIEFCKETARTHGAAPVAESAMPVSQPQNDNLPF
jgi:hypothetical protein